jgi:hypothetical protein
MGAMFFEGSASDPSGGVNVKLSVCDSPGTSPGSRHMKFNMILKKL